MESRTLSGAELQVAALQALDQARPDCIVAVLRPLLADHLGARDVRLLLTDYQLTALRAIDEPDRAVELRGTAAGEAFVSQLPAVRRDENPDVCMLYLPVSIRGERIGVLHLALPGMPAPDTLDELSRLATVVGYAVHAAARQCDLVARSARSHRLTLAAELQWQLLPGRGCRAPEYRIAGHLEPADHVHADAFDWSQDEGQLTVSLTDGATHGQNASLLTTLAVTAVRNARRAGLGIADQACLADQAVYAHHRGAEYVSALLVGIDLSTGQAHAIRAGSPRLLILRDGEVIVPRLSDQLPLGMFEGTDYVAEQFALATGDRLLLVSDGIHAAGSPTRELFGDTRLPQLLGATAGLPVGGVVRQIVDELSEHRHLAELDDDAAVICLDWLGPGNDAAAEVLPRFEPAAFGCEPKAHPRLTLVPGGHGDGRPSPRSARPRSRRSS